MTVKPIRRTIHRCKSFEGTPPDLTCLCDNPKWRKKRWYDDLRSRLRGRIV